MQTDFAALVTTRHIITIKTIYQPRAHNVDLRTPTRVIIEYVLGLGLPLKKHFIPKMLRKI